MSASEDSAVITVLPRPEAAAQQGARCRLAPRGSAPPRPRPAQERGNQSERRGAASGAPGSSGRVWNEVNNERKGSLAGRASGGRHSTADPPSCSRCRASHAAGARVAAEGERSTRPLLDASARARALSTRRCFAWRLRLVLDSSLPPPSSSSPSLPLSSSSPALAITLPPFACGRSQSKRFRRTKPPGSIRTGNPRSTPLDCLRGRGEPALHSSAPRAMLQRRSAEWAKRKGKNAP